MNFGLLTLICLCLAAPIATGLECITCTGTSVDGAANACVDAATSLPSTICPEAPSGQEARCTAVSIEASLLGTATKNADRSCKNVAANTPNTCTTKEEEVAGASAKYTECYCNDKDNCNGQTTLAPAIMTSLVGLAMAIYSVL